MTKKELKQYRKLSRDIQTMEKYIKKLQRAAENVPTVKDKVQSSQKEYPYLPTRETVDAPQPAAYTKLQRAIIKQERVKAEMVNELLRIDDFISRIEDERAKAIVVAVYVNGDKQKDVAIAYDLSYQRVSNIISENLAERNKR